MLVQFSVTNYRSIKNKVTLSMVAPERDAKEDHYPDFLETGFECVPYLTPLAALFGPNNTGKSNVLRAMMEMRSFVKNSSRGFQLDEPIDYEPFLFSSDTEKLPSEFEIYFIHNDKLYEYGYAVTDTIVTKEWLSVTLKDSDEPIKKLERTEDDINVLNIAPEAPVKHWIDSTRKNALFLSTASQMNAHDFTEPYAWISSSLRGDGPYPWFPGPLRRASPSHALIQDDLCWISEHMDRLGIKGIDLFLKEVERTVIYTRRVNPPDSSERLERAERIERTIKDKEIHTQRTLKGETYTLPFDEESEGTKRLFNILSSYKKINKEGGVLILDEPENGIHPHAIKAFISLFQMKHYNKNKSQLIFASQNESLIEAAGKDCIYAVEKDADFSTSLTPLTEYKDADDKNIKRDFLDGRYGAQQYVSILTREEVHNN